jgi:RimJ/RimL family protein N-acetyltransferase
MTGLTIPEATWHSSWLEAHREWGPGLHEDGFGLLTSDDVTSIPGFVSWLRQLSDDKQCTYWWITEVDQVLGGIALRHASHPLIPRAGHIGYGIRPSARRRGLATWAVGQVVARAHMLGMNQVMAVCASNNTASIKTLEHQGGVLDQTAHENAVRRYWIQTRSPHESAHPSP